MALFGSVMGIVGIGLAWRFAATQFAFSAAPGDALVTLGFVVFLIVAFRYASKARRRPDLVRAEFADRAAGVYFSAIPISVSLLALGAAPHWVPVATGLWAIGAAGSFGLWLVRLERWIVEPNDLPDLAPTWFLPAVGNAVAAIAGARLGHTEIAWFSFATAVGGWLTLLPLVFHRLIFHERIESRLTPSLFVIASAPALFASAWLALNGGHADPVFRFFAFQAFFAIVLVLRLTALLGFATFSVAWWGFTFPVAAVAGAALSYNSVVPSPLTATVALAALVAATILVAYVGFRQLRALRVPRATARSG